MELLKNLMASIGLGGQAPAEPNKAELKRAPAEADPLARVWNERIERSRKHWRKYHQRAKYNRELVAGFKKDADPKTAEFNRFRANLIQGTITSVLPNIYARNPEISAVPLYKADNLKLFCKTIETVTNRYLEQAGLKARGKSTVRSALTSSIGIVKVMYQRDIQDDPVIRSRMNDTQDNIKAIEHLMAEIDDPEQRGDLEAKRLELEQAMQALNEKVEVTAAEGLVIDRVLFDNFLMDEAVEEFADYRNADWQAQIIPMKRSTAEKLYGFKLDGARAYVDAQDSRSDGRLASGTTDKGGDVQIAVIEVWDRVTQRVLTFAEGCNFWLREPYSPSKVGQRWYPYFLLPFQEVDGQVYAPSLVDLTEKLQAEHNEARDRFNKHRDLAIPGWIASGDTSDKALKNFAKSVSINGFGEVAVIDTEGKPITQVFAPKQYPPIDPMVYDTGPVRNDWEMVTGLQDAARSSVVKPKTATEASIMDRALSGRVSEFRDLTEDFIQEIAQYSAQILVMELTPQQVERIMGPHKVAIETMPDGTQVEQVVERSYDWPELTREQVFDMIEMRIRAGTSGAPDKMEQQENWTKVLPVVQGLVVQIIQLHATGQDAGPLVELLRETIKRFDERLEVEMFIPKAPMMPAMPGAPGAAPQPAAGPAPAIA